MVSAACSGGDAKPVAQPSVATSPAARSSTAESPSSSAPGGGLFTAPVPWTKDVSGEEKSDRSEAIIAALDDSGGWGNDNVLQTDFSIPIFFADAITPADAGRRHRGVLLRRPGLRRGARRDAGAGRRQHRGVAGLTCDFAARQDCHLLVVDRDESKLYELYQATKEGDDMTAGGLFVWDLDKEYPDTLRGEQCTSADAAGFPIAALTPTADEVASGAIDHALRFILPNDRMKDGRVRRDPRPTRVVRRAPTRMLRPTACGSG